MDNRRVGLYEDKASGKSRGGVRHGSTLLVTAGRPRATSSPQPVRKPCKTRTLRRRHSTGDEHEEPHGQNLKNASRVRMQTRARQGWPRHQPLLQSEVCTPKIKAPVGRASSQRYGSLSMLAASEPLHRPVGGAVRQAPGTSCDRRIAQDHCSRSLPCLSGASFPPL